MRLVELLEQDERSLRRILDGLDATRRRRRPASAGIDVIDACQQTRHQAPRSAHERSTIHSAAQRGRCPVGRRRAARPSRDRRARPARAADHVPGRRRSKPGVSARYLYAHPQLRATIQQLRDEQHRTPSRPHRHPRASDESIRARLRGALEENKQLRAENAQLRDELALAHGEIRELKLATPPAEHAMSEWPAPVAEQALHGPAGEFVLRTEPHSEAHPMALLSQFLVAFGCACGRGAYYQVEADRHYTNEFVVLVGPTATGRKGSSWGHVRRLLADADQTFAALPGRRSLLRGRVDRPGPRPR